MTSISEIFSRHRTDKGPSFHDYGRQYERLLDSQRGRPLAFLEIGVEHGESLRAWREVFPDARVIAGLDVDPRCLAEADSDRGIFVEIGDAASALHLERLLDTYGPFDVIVDDGSHANEDVIRAFEWMFPHLLAEGGTYIVEGTVCWKAEQYQNNAFPDHLEFFWKLTRHLNQWRYDSHAGEKDHCVDPFKIQKVTYDSLERCVDRIEFGCSYVAIEKRTRHHWAPCERSADEEPPIRTAQNTAR